MKKMTMKAIVVLAILAFSTSAFAVTSITSAGLTIGGSTFTPSTNVTIAVISTASAYAATSKHLNGSKEYGTLSSSATIGSKDLAVGVASPTSPTSATALNGTYTN